MAKEDLGVWQQKNYGAEGLAAIEAGVVGTKVERMQLDQLDEEIAQQVDTPDSDTVKRWARLASGLGNKLRKLAVRLEASVRNAESSRYVEILFECDRDGKKFLDGAAKADASNFVSELRKARNLFLGYTESCDKILTMCRLHTGQSEVNQSNDIST